MTSSAPIWTQLARAAARRTQAAALETKVDACLTAHAGEPDQQGRPLVVGNGHAPQRQR